MPPLFDSEARFVVIFTAFALKCQDLNFMSNNFRSIIVAPSARFKDFINPGFYEGCRIVSLLKNKSNLSDFWEKTAKLLATLNQLSGGESQLANTYDEKLKCIGAADYYFISENETTQDWDEETMNFLYKLSSLLYCCCGKSRKKVPL